MANTQPAAAFDTLWAAQRLENKIDNLPIKAALYRALWSRTGAIVGTVVAAAGAIIAVAAPS